MYIYIYGRRAAHHWSLPEVFRFLPRWCQTSRKWWKPSTARCPPSMTWLRLLKRRTTPHLWSATGWLLSYLYIYIWKLNEQISPPLKSQHTTVCFYGVYIYMYIYKSLTNWRVDQHSDFCMTSWFIHQCMCIYMRMVDDLRRIVGKLEEQYMTEIKMDDLDKTPKSPKLHAFLTLFGYACI